MRKYERITALLVFLILGLGLIAGCGNNSNEMSKTGDLSTEGENGTEEGKGDTVKKPNVEIVFAQDIGTDEKANQVVEDILKEYQDTADVNIKLESLPQGDYRTWLTTQFSANEGPDVYTGILYDLATDYNSGWLYNFVDLFEEENPYDPGHAWKETLPDYILNRMYITEKDVPGYPTATSVVRIFCNTEIFEEAGAKIPETWAEFMDSCQKIKESGVIPFAFPNASIADLSWLWFNNSVGSQLNNDLVAKVDVSGNGYAELNEIVKAWDEGNIDFSSESFIEGYEMMKEFSEYWTSDFNGLDQKSAIDMFIRGEVAMVQAMSIDLSAIDQVVENGFNYEVIPVPTIMTETSAHAMNKSVILGGQPDVIYGINKNIEKDSEKLEMVIDFIHYMSSPAIQARLAEEVYRIPLATNTELPEHLQGFIITEEPLRIAYYTGINEKLRNYFHRAGQQYLEGSIDVKEFSKLVNQSYDEVIEEIKLENDWTEENNYGID